METEEDEAALVQEGERCHDAEAQQDEEDLEQLSLGGVELVRQDLHEGDVDKGARGQALQDGLDQRTRRQRRLSQADAHGDAQRRHCGKHANVGGQPRRTYGALHQLHRQAENDDALVHQDGNADLQDLDWIRRANNHIVWPHPNVVLEIH